MRSNGFVYMAWFENSPLKNLVKIVEEGEKHYFEKYGVYPKYVFLNKKYDDGIKAKTDEVISKCVVRFNKTICNNIFGFSMNESIDTINDGKKLLG